LFLLQLFKELQIVGNEYSVAGSLYGMSNIILEELFERGFIVIIPVRDEVHTRINTNTIFRKIFIKPLV